MLVKQQAEEFLRVARTRRKNPVRPSTLRVYRSLIDRWILPELGDISLKNIGNRAARRLVDRMSEAGLETRSMWSVIHCLKAIVKSAKDEDGNILFPKTWDSDFMDLPEIENGSNAPLLGSQSLGKALSSDFCDQDRSLYVLLAGSGLRVGEALSLSTDQNLGSFWNPETATIHVQSTLDHAAGEIRANPKTRAGVRQVDVHPVLNEYLLRNFRQSDGLLFQRGGRPLVYSTVLRRMHQNGIPEAFHAFRRFRATHLELQNVPRGLVQFWLGHASQTVTDGYIKIGQNMQARKEWCERAGLGFEL